jgi:hypothetical protein
VSGVEVTPRADHVVAVATTRSQPGENSSAAAVRIAPLFSREREL